MAQGLCLWIIDTTLKFEVMRKLILITGIFALFFTSCYREPVYNPYADFGVDYSLVIPGEVIFFNNYSDHADYYLWDFGDGYTSSQFQPDRKSVV